MARADFSLEIEIPTTRKRLRDFLADLHHYRALHPLIESIEDLPPVAERPASQRYRVVDRIPVGPFRFRTSYVAELEPAGPHEILGRAWQRPGVELQTTYRLEDAARGVLLREHVAVSAPRLLLGFVTRQARAAHSRTLGALRSSFASRASQPDPARPR